MKKKKKENPKRNQNKHTHTHTANKGIMIWITSEFSSEIMEARKHRITFLKYWNKNNNKNKITPNLTSRKNILEWRWIETFSDNWNQRIHRQENCNVRNAKECHTRCMNCTVCNYFWIRLFFKNTWIAQAKRISRLSRKLLLSIKYI